MVDIFTEVKGLKVPEFNADFYEEERQEEEYVNKVIEYAKLHGKGEFRGNEIRFPVGDGYARYIVLSLRPIQLIHLNVGDAWHFRYVKNITAKDIKEQIDKQKSLELLFS